MKDCLQKYYSDPEVRQVLVVTGSHLSEGEARLLTKGPDGWKEVLRSPAVLGREGLGKEREGDMKTPVGDFGIICAFGIKDNPGTSLDYVPVDGSLYCCSEQGPDYNRLVWRSCEGEHLCEYVPEYNYGIFPDFNAGGVYPAGSAIFIHVRGAKNHTAGCVALPEDVMVKILCSLEKGARIIIGPALQAKDI